MHTLRGADLQSILNWGVFLSGQTGLGAGHSSLYGVGELTHHPQVSLGEQH